MITRTARGLVAAALVVLIPVLTSCSHLVILHDPLTAHEHGDLGVAYESGAKLALAEKEYRHALRLAPRQSRTRVNLGNVQAARSDWHGAERSYRRALRDSSTNTDAMNNLSVALMRQGHHRAEATALAERAVQASPVPDSNYVATLTEVRAWALRDTAAVTRRKERS